MARELDDLPDLVFGRGLVRAKGLQLIVEALLLAADPRPTEERQALELAQALPQPVLGLTGQRGGGAGRCTPAARIGAGSRRSGRSAGSARRCRSPRAASPS